MPTQSVHRLKRRMLNHRVSIVVVGCGGTGSALLSGLPYLHHALLAAGHPKGLQVYADQSIKVEAKMEVGGATQTVEVSATTVEQLKTDRADVSTTFTTKEVQDLPIGDRNFTNLQLP